MGIGQILIAEPATEPIPPTDGVGELLILLSDSIFKTSLTAFVLISDNMIKFSLSDVMSFSYSTTDISKIKASDSIQLIIEDDDIGSMSCSFE